MKSELIVDNRHKKSVKRKCLIQENSIPEFNRDADEEIVTQREVKANRYDDWLSLTKSPHEWLPGCSFFVTCCPHNTGAAIKNQESQPI